MNRAEYTAARRDYRDARSRHEDAVAACEFADYRANALRMIGAGPDITFPMPAASSVGALLRAQASRRAAVIQHVQRRRDLWLPDAEQSMVRAVTEYARKAATAKLVYARRRPVALVRLGGAA